jgi:hypothetical protein
VLTKNFELHSAYEPKLDKTKAVDIDPTFSILKHRETDPNYRPVVSGSLGMHVEGVCLPKPDLRHADTTLDGAMYRFCRDMPKLSEEKPEFVDFVKKWLNKNLPPLPVDTDLSVETWLSNTDYTEARKEELRKLIPQTNPPDLRKCAEVKSFVKDEFYPEYKHARAINSRSDIFKVLCGPIFKAIEKKLFALKPFIKKVPVDKRPEYIVDLIHRIGHKYFTTDYTSFESHFTRMMQMQCDFILLDHMTKNLPIRDTVELIKSVLAGENVIKFKNSTIKIQGKKMSGEMNTSLSNGFANLMFCLYILETHGCKEIEACIEGDDGIGSYIGPEPKKEWFEEFGLLIKMELHERLETASFCGLVFDVVEKMNISDPRKILATFGWTSAQYVRSKKTVHMNLLRCKALSLAYQYPGCPITTTLASKVMHLTSGYDTIKFMARQGSKIGDAYYRDLVKAAAEKNAKHLLVLQEPGPRTRLLVEELYGITLKQQIDIENYIESIDTVKPLSSPLITSIMPDIWKTNWNNYVVKKNKYDINFDYEPDFFCKVRRRNNYAQFMAH